MMGKVNTKDKKFQETKNYLLPLTSYLSKKNGQVAVILIIVVAAALIFYAISINLGRISQIKTITTVAADTGASQTASFIASFGQAIFKTQLGGRTTRCGLTGAAAAIAAFIIIVITVIVSYACVGTCGPAVFQAALVIIAALAAVVLEIAVIQPGLTDKFNEIPWHSMSDLDAVTETGVQTALFKVATDNVSVADLDDSDMDRIWGLDNGGQPRDKISRLGFYYGQRLQAIFPPPLADVQNFFNALKNFLRKDLDNWGIYDDTGPVCAPFSANSECNPCCVLPSPETWKPEMGCGDPDNLADVQNMRDNVCAPNSPYGVNYPWVYDPYRENPVNNDPLSPDFFISFREQLGRDDEHRDFRKNPDDDLLTPVYDGPNGIQASLPDDGFRLEDTTGFHAADNRPGVFKFFYKIADWGVNLDYNVRVMGDPLNPQCNWCDLRSGTTCDVSAIYPPEMSQLSLPLDPGILTYNKTYCVDGINATPLYSPGDPPLAVDLVKLPDPGVLPFLGNPNIGKIEADATQCVPETLDPGTGFWKRGGDRFCSVGGDAWPYYEMCAKYGPNPPSGACTIVDNEDPLNPLTSSVPCQCGEGDALPPDNWPDDALDGLVYGLNFFIDWANVILSKDVPWLAKEFRKWYPSSASWIEPGTSNSPPPTSDPACTSCCYMCEPEDGSLWVWYKGIREMKKRLQAWRDTSFASTGCTEVWCVPANGCPGGKDATGAVGDPQNLGPEDATFGTGKIPDVVACLNWNVNDRATTTSSAPVTATGNYEKFLECDRACVDVQNNVNLAQRAVDADDLCSALPRSLVPNFDTLPFVRPTPLLLKCADDCNACIIACAGDAACEAACTCGGCACSDAACLSTQTANAKGSCADTTAGGFMDLLEKSIPEAANQVAKFKLRYNFLNGRLTEMDNLINILQTAEDKFREFLSCPDGAACKLIKARIDFDKQKPGLPYYAIYGWQGGPEKGAPADSGKWHIARVDVRVPERCDQACDVNQDPNPPDARWPYVKGEDRNLGMSKCMMLKGKNGIVKVRVSRFDETGGFSTLLFPNAVEIWKPMFSRGDRPLTSDPRTIGTICNSSMARDPCPLGPGLCPLASPGSYYYGAFILNKREDDPVCWDLANRLLASGVTSEACARYYFHEGTPNGMDFKFVSCKDF